MAKRKPKREYTVYAIYHNSSIVYYGRTQNLHQRELRHNRDLKKGVIKDLYVYLRQEGRTDIVLVPIQTFKDKVTSKRYEDYLILVAWWAAQRGFPWNLKQRIPKISDF